MAFISLSRGIADQRLQCNLCEHVIEPAELFWRGRLNDSDRDCLWICTGHIPPNATGMVTVASPEDSLATHVRAEAVDVRREIISMLLADWDVVYSLTPEEFEELVFDRLLALELQAFRMGSSNRKDGGIDVVFWTNGLLPILGAVQIKHRRTPEAKIGPAVVREFSGALQGHQFNIGLIITNSSFTEEAKHQARVSAIPIQLRDGEVLRKWVADDFTTERIEFVMRNAEFCKGLFVPIPHFG